MKSAQVPDGAPPAPRHAMVKLADIRIDGGSQQRPLSQEALESYEERRLGGEEFPPVQTVFDGLHHWLWDGFHRVHVARKVGDKMIMVEITEGTQRDAVWLSFGANKSHGVPRVKGCTAEIIKKIFADPEWAKVPQTKIAQHVGVSPEFISKVRASINRLIDAQSEKADADDFPDAPIKTVTRKGKTYQMKVGQIGKAKKPRAKKFGGIAKDAAVPIRKPGQMIPTLTVSIPLNNPDAAAGALLSNCEPAYLRAMVARITTVLDERGLS